MTQIDKKKDMVKIQSKGGGKCEGERKRRRRWNKCESKK